MPKESPKQSTEEAPDSSIDAVRDLLFGKRTAEITGQISQTEESLNEAIENLEDRFEGKISGVESFLKDQTKGIQKRCETLERRIKSEEEARIKQGEEIRQFMEHIEGSLNEKFDQLEERLSDFESQIGKDLHDRSSQISEDSKKLRRELINRMNTGLASVANKSTDRTELGDFLIDLGLRIHPSKEQSKDSDKQTELAR